MLLLCAIRSANKENIELNSTEQVSDTVQVSDENVQLTTQAEVFALLPPHLQEFVIIQENNSYTPRDHAVWRFTIKNLLKQLKNSACDIFFKGVKENGITLEDIPSIDHLNLHLRKIGWKLVIIDGFLSTPIFMEFLKLKILTVSLEMRSVEHILYTPAPDILHESVGHGSFLADADYAKFLQYFGEIGSKAMLSQHDFDVFEKVRRLSLIKESPYSSSESIAIAEEELVYLLEKDVPMSESQMVSNLFWWTVEFGVFGEVDDYQFYGAGLCSSLSESITCLDNEKVLKLPLTLDCIKLKYDFTRAQPRLFVAKNIKHLHQILEDFARGLCYMKGGAESVEKAISAKVASTCEWASGIQVSGLFTKLLCDAIGNETYLCAQGPIQLSYNEIEIDGYGRERLNKGFGSPVGMVKGLNQCLSLYSIEELRSIGIEEGKRVILEFVSGITVNGLLENIYRNDHKNLFFSFDDCSVYTLDREVLFKPECGAYHMAIGKRISSVFGGPADHSKWSIYRSVVTKDSVIKEPEPRTEVMGIYEEIKEMRVTGSYSPDQIRLLHSKLCKNFPKEWLALAELLECCNQKNSSNAETNLIGKSIKQNLLELQKSSPENERLIAYALEENEL